MQKVDFEEYLWNIRALILNDNFEEYLWSAIVLIQKGDCEEYLYSVITLIQKSDFEEHVWSIIHVALIPPNTVTSRNIVGGGGVTLGNLERVCEPGF